MSHYSIVYTYTVLYTLYGMYIMYTKKERLSPYEEDQSIISAMSARFPTHYFKPVTRETSILLFFTNYVKCENIYTNVSDRATAHHNNCILDEHIT